MNKKILCLITIVLTFAMCITTFPLGVFAQQADEVILSFVLGENSVLVNGEVIEYEAPYLSQDGVVLVPADLISDAFDADISYSEEDGTIILNYSDVEIFMVIGNTGVDVNGYPDVLSSVPEIKDGTPMLPLRFISETYGMIVSYDNETKTITVGKEADDAGSMIEGGIETLKIGDSFYNWSIENPADLTVEDRSNDGLYTSLCDEYYDKSIDITIEEIEDDYEFLVDYRNSRYSVMNSTLTFAEYNDTDPLKRTFRIKQKRTMSYEDLYVVVTDKYRYMVEGYCYSDEKETWDEISRLVSTFDLSFNSEETHDLYKNKADDSYELYEDEELNLSLEIPSVFDLDNQSYLENEIEFSSDEEGYEESFIRISIFSKGENIDALSLTNRKYAYTTKYYNSDICDIDDKISEVTYSNVSGYEYRCNINGEYMDANICYASFEIGDYIYDFCIALNTGDNNTEKQIKYILNSFKAEEIDSKEFGDALYNIPEITGNKYISRGEGWQLEVPEEYIESKDEESATYVLNDGLINLHFDMSDKSIRSLADIKETFSELESMKDYFETFEIVQPLRMRMIGKDQYYEFAFASSNYEDSPVEYNHFLATYKKGRAVAFGISTSENVYSESTIDEFYDIVASFKINK